MPGIKALPYSGLQPRFNQFAKIDFYLSRSRKDAKFCAVRIYPNPNNLADDFTYGYFSKVAHVLYITFPIDMTDFIEEGTIQVENTI